MKAAVITAYGDRQVLQLAEIPVPQAKDGEAVVAVVASSINPVDVKSRTPGTSQQVATFPAVLGWDVSGIVGSAPTGSGWVPGDRVIAMRPPSPDGLGSWADYVTVPVQHLVAAPRSTDLPTAAALPLAGLTAQQALDELPVSTDARLLVTGAVGAVGGLAVQLARRAGLHVTALVSRPSHVDAALELGAHVATSNLHDVAEHSLVLDTAGILNHPHLLSPGGTLVTISDDELPTWPAERNATVKRNYVRHAPEQLATLRDLVDQHELTLRVNSHFPLHDVQAAHAHAETPGNLGKCLLIM